MRQAARLASALGLLVACVSPALGDSIQDARGITFTGTIRGIGEKGIILRKDQGGSDSFALVDVGRIQVDGKRHVNQAENLRAEGKFKKAVEEYQAARLRAREDWLKQWIDARLIEGYGNTEQFSRAVETLVSLCRQDSKLVAWVKLPEVRPKGSPDNEAALSAVESALESVPEGPATEKLKQLRLNILLVQGEPTKVLRIIEKQLDSADLELRQRARLKQIELLLKIERYEDAGQAIEIARNGQGEKFKPLDPQHDPQLLYLEGRYLHGTEDYTHAALSFMRVPILYSRRAPDLAAECLYLAGKSMYESEVVPLGEVVSPLREAVENYPETRGAEKAGELLRKIQQAGS